MSARFVIGILLAAGKGSRMGRTKQLIAVPTDNGPKPLVAAAFDSIEAICDRVIVVVGCDKDRVIEALGARRFEIAESCAGAEMTESVRVAFRAAKSAAPEQPLSASNSTGDLQKSAADSVTFAGREATLLLQLADHPRVRRCTLDRLLESSAESLRKVIIPRFRNRGGHPILIPPTVAAMLTAAPLEGGLRAFWHANPSLCEYVEVDDAGVTMDLDTPDDLASLTDD